MKRILLGGIVGGILMFVWGWVSHMVLPIWKEGVQVLPDQPAFVQRLDRALDEPGFYVFPAVDDPESLSEEESAEFTKRHVDGPTGVVIFKPTGEEPMGAPRFGRQLLTCFLTALIVAYVLRHSRSGYLGRIALCSLMGAFASGAVLLPFWNWYSFPETFVRTAALDLFVGWTLVGVVLAAIARPPRED